MTIPVVLKSAWKNLTGLWVWGNPGLWVWGERDTITFETLSVPAMFVVLQLFCPNTALDERQDHDRFK